MARKFYACKCLFKKGINAINLDFGKRIYVFNSQKSRDQFLSENTDELEFYKVTQKEAYAVTNLNKANSVPCVYTLHDDLFILADAKQCYGSNYLLMNEFA